MSSFSLILTEECDWDCEYCYFPNSHQKSPSLSVYQKHLPYIKKVMDKLDEVDLLVNIDIQGGEVGLISESMLEYFFETIKHKVSVSTNGMFLSKKYHLNKKIRPYIRSIMWHLCKEPGNFKIVDYEDDDIYISRGIVHRDADEMIDFIKMNNHITFDYVEFEFDIKREMLPSMALYGYLYDRISSITNVTHNAKEILKRRLMETEDHRDNCRKYNGSILIDLVNEKICLCQRQLNENIELTEKNLLMRLNTFPEKLFKGDGCNTCTRLYSGKFFGNVIERAMLIRTRL